MSNNALCETKIPNREPVARGKVRDIYDLGDRLLIVATDRISAFDWVNPVGIPDKGKILTQMSLFWFEQARDLVRNHLISAELSDFPRDFQDAADQVEGRSMLVHKCEMFPVEFVIRGYLAGSGWKEYRQKGTVCGHQLPKGLVEASKLDEPIFTPATKATDGHDINISPEEAAEIIGQDWMDAASSAARSVYLKAREIARSRGIILCDTKFEFGVRDGQLMLADEVLTPDSSRLARRSVPAGQEPAKLRQTIRARLARDNGLGQEFPATGLARRDRDEDP